MIYDISCLAIPFDVMSEKYLETPRSWSTKGLKKFMFYFGPTSSVFDILTFAFLFFILGPAMLGHTYFDLNQAQQLQFMMMFNTGWFIESLWTQEMVIHALRDKRIPFIQTKASFPLMVSTIGAGIIGTVIPYLDFGKDLGFEVLPLSYLFFVLLMLVFYFVLVTIVKKNVTYNMKMNSFKKKIGEFRQSFCCPCHCEIKIAIIESIPKKSSIKRNYDCDIL